MHRGITCCFCVGCNVDVECNLLWGGTVDVGFNFVLGQHRGVDDWCNMSIGSDSGRTASNVNVWLIIGAGLNVFDEHDGSKFNM